MCSGLDELRKKGSLLGIYGLNEKQTAFLQREYVPTKSQGQIKTAVLAGVSEHIITSHRVPIDVWNDLFQTLYPEEALEKTNEALANFLIDEANKHTVERRKTERERRASGQQCPDEVNFAEIYSYLASIVKNQEDQPPMSSQSATCLLNAVENIEKQAEIVMNAELEEELTERYATLIGNTKIVPEKLRRRTKDYSVTENVFDVNNPLALDLSKWNAHFNEQLAKHKNLIFPDFVETSEEPETGSDANVSM